MRGPPRFLPALVAAAATVTALCAPGVIALAQSRPLTAAAEAAAIANGAYLETFDGSPAAPQPYAPKNTLNAAYAGVLNPYVVQGAFVGHGPDCAGPNATHQLTGSPMNGMFLCRDHVMTSGSESMRMALVPGVTTSAAGEGATVRFDMSTRGSSNRDWTEFWLVRYEDDYPKTGDEESPPLNGIKVIAHLPSSDADQNAGWFNAEGFKNGVKVWDSPNCCGPMFSARRPVSSVERTTFEFKVSQSRVSFKAPALGMTWVDAPLPAGLVDWDKSIAYLHHAAYTPDKGGDCPPTRTDCGHNTWHWDNIQISPATPLTIRDPQARLADAAAPELVFDGPAARGSLFRAWAQQWQHLQHSYDGGASWQDTPLYRGDGAPEHLQSLKFPVPDGTTRVRFRKAGGGNFVVGDARLVSEVVDGSPPPVGTPPPTAAPAATATPPAATATPPAAPPTATRTPAAATATRTPAATAAATATAVAATATSAAATATRPAAPSATPAPRTFTISGSANPGTVAPGGAVALSVQVTSATAGPALIDFEVYGPNGQRVYQTVRDGQAFSAGQTRTFTASWTVPSDTPAGTYTLKVGVFSVGWGQLYAWNDQVAQVRMP